MIKFIRQAICASLFLLIALQCFAYYDLGKPIGHVNDFANVINDEQQQKLETKLSEFTKNSSNEISIVTIKSLDGDTIEDFAVQLFKNWGIGKKERDNGVLILAAIDDKKMRIEVGYGLEGALTDAQSFWIINQIMKPAFRFENYYQGFDNAVDKIIGATRGEYIPNDQPLAQNNKINNNIKTLSHNLEYIFYIIIFGAMWLASILGRSKSWWLGGIIGAVAGVIIGFFVGLYFSLIAVAILSSIGLLFDYIVSKSYHKSKATGIWPWWFGGGGGGFGGSGGFGGFGGGSSGGGGASGDW